MSRIGKKPVAIPAAVEVKCQGTTVSVKGPKGDLAMDLPPLVSASVEGKVLTVARADATRQSSAMQGLARSLIFNMVHGVSEGFQKTLQIEGVGYQARTEGSNLVLQIGFCHEVVMPIPEGLEVEVPARTKNIHIRGADKQLVGQFAADVRAVRPPEPYKGKGIRYSDEVVRRKAGKAQVGSGG